MSEEKGRSYLHYEIIGAEKDAPWMIFVHGAGCERAGLESGDTNPR